MPPSRNAQGRVDRVRGLAVVGSKQVRIDRKGDAGLGVPEAFRDRDDVDPGVDELAGMGVTQGVERDFGQVSPQSEDVALATPLKAAEKRTSQNVRDAPIAHRVAKHALDVTGPGNFTASGLPEAACLISSAEQIFLLA